MGPQHGVQYFLRIDILGDEWSEEVGAFFGEEGQRGVREAMVMVMLGMPKDWMQDPYDKNFKKGIRRNKSEDEKFDSQFPYHPLTQARVFLNYIIDNN